MARKQQRLFDQPKPEKRKRAKRLPIDAARAEAAHELLLRLAKALEEGNSNDLWTLLGYPLEDCFIGDEELDDYRDEVAALIEDVNRVAGSAIPVPPDVRGDPDAERGA